MDLFDNPMVKAAKASMSDEQKLRYQTIGEQMYGGFNFPDGKVENADNALVESAAYIVDSLRAGQHPSTLEDKEKVVMLETFGSKWFVEYGYKKEDLDSIVTLNITKEEEKSPDLEEEKSPDLEEEKSPDLEEEKSPDLEEEKSPDLNIADVFQSADISSITKPT